MEGLLDSFSLTIKIGTDKIKFTIVTIETKDQMFEKLKLIHPQCASKKMQTLNKLKLDLQSKVKTHNLKPNLLKTIQYYLAQNFSQDSSPKIQRLCRSKSNNKQQISFTNTQNGSLKDSPAKINPNHTVQPQKLLEKADLEKDRKQQTKKYGSIQPKKKSLSQSQPKKQTINQDLVKAYQTIMQKSTQADIKMMAKKCLEQLGKLPQTQRVKQTTATIRFQKEKESELAKPAEEPKTEEKQHHGNSRANFSSEKSPIQRMNLQISKREKQPTVRLNHQQSLQRSKLSQSTYSKDFKAKRYNYAVNSNLQQTQEKMFELSKLSESWLRNNNGRKFNYLQNFS